MTTIADALQAAADALNNAVTQVLGLRDQISAQLAKNVTAAQTVVNNFLARPLQQTYYVDPANGNDATGDGLSLATAWKSLDKAISVASNPSLGTVGSVVLLFGDIVLRKRFNMAGTLQLVGVQPQNTSTGYGFARRQLSFLGIADNSPDPNLGVTSAGIIFTGSSSLSTADIDIKLPAVPAGTPGFYDSPFIGVNNLAIALSPFTLLVEDSTARSLIGSFLDGNTGNAVGHITATIFASFGQGATGHLFRGIAAGSDPNSVFAYQTNIKSA